MTVKMNINVEFIIKENKLQQIKDELDDCNEEKKFFKNMKDIQSILLDLVVKGIVDQRLDKKYVLSINGKELLSMIRDPFEKNDIRIICPFYLKRHLYFIIS